MTDRANTRGFGRHPKGIAKDRRLKPGPMRVLIALCDYADPEGRCYPNQATVAKDIGTTVQKVSAYTRELVSLGYIEKTPRGRSVGYLIPHLSKTGNSHPEHLPEPDNNNEQHLSKTGNPDLSDLDNSDLSKTDKRNNTIEQDHFNKTPLPPKRGKRQTSKPTREQREWFAEWFAVFPSDDNQDPALKAYVRALKDVGREVLLDGATRYRAFVEAHATPDQFIKKPNNFLRERCWKNAYTIGEPTHDATTPQPASETERVIAALSRGVGD